MLTFAFSDQVEDLRSDTEESDAELEDLGLETGEINGTCVKEDSNTLNNDRNALPNDSNATSMNDGSSIPDKDND